MRIYTLGTDHRPEHEFSRILGKYRFETVFDIRRTPESREEHFKRSGLEALCSAARASYVFLGNEMGGPRDRNYAAWTRTEEYRRGFGIIRAKIEKRVCCILCAERSPEGCHRRFIADELAKQGIEVVHLLDETTTWPPRPAGRTGPAR
jgi:uncharacterized protein (DUF488 family)